MPLNDGYGVLVGTLLSYSCDAGHTNGHYYHCTLMVKTRFAHYRCPVDLDSKEQATGIEWRIIELGDAQAFPLSAMGNGWHRLESHPGSGALDYCRSSLFPADGIWERGTGRRAFMSMEPLLSQASRLFIFGEPFRTGRGVHNIHQNQGDPPSSRWAPENGPWQDGAIVVERRDGTVAAFLCRFRSQRPCEPDAGSLPA
ncbi:MAG: YukJ family protein [Chlorobiaceae bacterium]|nr:YukJ family protein [Chlorobiaceae bacterium]